MIFAKENIFFSQHLKKLWMNYGEGKSVDPIGRKPVGKRMCAVVRWSACPSCAAPPGCGLMGHWTLSLLSSMVLPCVTHRLLLLFYLQTVGLLSTFCSRQSYPPVLSTFQTAKFCLALCLVGNLQTPLLCSLGARNTVRLWQPKMSPWLFRLVAPANPTCPHLPLRTSALSSWRSQNNGVLSGHLDSRLSTAVASAPVFSLPVNPWSLR